MPEPRFNFVPAYLSLGRCLQPPRYLKLPLLLGRERGGGPRDKKWRSGDKTSRRRFSGYYLRFFRSAVLRVSHVRHRKPKWPDVVLLFRLPELNVIRCSAIIMNSLRLNDFRKLAIIPSLQPAMFASLARPCQRAYARIRIEFVNKILTPHSFRDFSIIFPNFLFLSVLRRGF